MELNNWRDNPPKQEPALDPNDWRSQLQANSRGRIVNKVIDTLKSHLPSSQEGINELRKIAVRFEEKIYAGATSQSDYLRKISLKMLTMENRSQTNTANPTNSAGNINKPSDSGSLGMQSQVLNQGQSLPIPMPANQPQPNQHLISLNNPSHNIVSGVVQNSNGLPSPVPQNSNLTQTSLTNVAPQNSNMQTLSGVTQNSGGNSMGQVFANNSQRQMQGRQQLLPQQVSQQSQNQQQYLYQQMMKQKLQQQQGNIQQPMMQSQQNVVQTNQLQSGHQSSGMQQPMVQSATLSNLQQNQQSVLRQPQQGQSNAGVHQQKSLMTQQQQQIMGPQLNAGNMQQNQLIGQQNNQQQQRLLSQQNKNQLMAQQNNVSNLHQQQLLGTQANQQSMQMLQQPKISLPSPQTQSQQQQMMPHNMQSQPAQMQPNALPRLQASGPLIQQQNVMDQQKQIHQTQRALPETSSTSLDSTAQTGQANGSDWKEEVYQKIKSMKDLYFNDLTGMYQKILATLQQESLPQQPKPEQIEKLKIFKTMLERMISFLQATKENLHPSFKNKLSSQSQITQVQGQQSNSTSLQQKSLSSLSGVSSTPQNTINSGQGNQLSPLAQGGIGSIQQKPTSQQANINSLAPQNGVNMLQQNTNQLQTNNILQQQTQQIKNMQQRRTQQQMIQKQRQMNDANDMKTRQGMGIDKTGTFQQNLVPGQRSAYPNQNIKAGSSPQMLQNTSSLQVDQKNLLSTQTKIGVPLQSANSPFIVPSPSTPLAPSPMLAESVEKPVMSNVENTAHQQTMVVPQAIIASSNAIGTPGISASPLLGEFSSPAGTPNASQTNEKSAATEQPLERLIKAVTSISSKALKASVEDIGSVVFMMDQIAGSAPGNGSRAAIGEDLAATVKCRRQARKFMTQEGLTGSMKMKRYMDVVPLNVVSSAGSMNENYKQFSSSEISDLESTATSGIKRRRLEVSTLLEEIREINQRLIDTVVDINNEDDLAEGGKGTTVTCSFVAVALSSCLKSYYGSALMPPIQPMRLMVPANYPISSPVPLDLFPVEVSNGYEDLSVKTRSRFSRSLRTLSQPLSLKDLATTWDASARAAITEHAQEMGGGSFSSKYGAWEDCSSAA
ncbi:hypothetical protein ACFE04_031638 [Oxalis oulophora]